MPTEKWLPIPGYEGRYCVSDHGNVMSMSYMGTGLPGLISFSLSRGYRSIELQTGPIKKRFTVHRLVMMAFVGPRPNGMHINHIDGVKTNNRRENLEYITPSENQKHSHRIGLQSNVGENHSQAVLNEAKVRSIRRKAKAGMSKHALAAEFGVSYSAIHYVINGKRWGHVKNSEEIQ